MFRSCVSIMAVVAAAVLLFVEPLYAADTVFGIPREQWDLAWKIINFLALIYLVVKYGKGPLTNFLRSCREQVETKLGDLESEEGDLSTQEAEQEEQLANIDERIGTIKDVYHRIGEDQKQAILQQAEEMRRRILEDAEKAAENEFRKAATLFRHEVVEMAVELAEKRIREKLTSKDHQTLVDNYLKGLVEKSQHAA